MAAWSDEAHEIGMRPSRERGRACFVATCSCGWESRSLTSSGMAAGAGGQHREDSVVVRGSRGDVPEAAHVFDASGITSNGAFYVCCSCGWRSALCRSREDCSVELRDHVDKMTMAGQTAS